MRPLILCPIALLHAPSLHAEQWLPGYTNGGSWVKDQLAAMKADAKAIDGSQVQLVFLGDSITCFWRAHERLWRQSFGQWTPLNLGIGGDGTEHMRWRLANGRRYGLEPAGLDPRVVVMMAGTNNLGQTPERRAEDVHQVLADVQQRWPKAVVLLMSITPRRMPGHPMYEGNRATNPLIKAFTDGQRVIWIDLAAQMTWDGKASKGIGGDLVHFTDEGYQMWAESIKAPLTQLMRQDPSRPAPIFPEPAAVAKVAELQASIAAGKVGAGVEALQQLAHGHDADAANAAEASLAIIAGWRSGIDAAIARTRADGDIVSAAELASGMAAVCAGEVAKAYREQSAELTKEPAYAAGREYRKLAAIPVGEREQPAFAAAVAAFLKENPEGYYARQAAALVPVK